VFRAVDVVELDFARNVVVIGENGSFGWWCRFDVVKVLSFKDQVVN